MPKRVQLAKALLSYDVIKHGGTKKIVFCRENRQKFKIFAVKLLNIEILPGVQKEMTIQTCFESFNFIVCRYCQKTEKDCVHPLPPPYPLTKVVFFSIEMTAKDVKEITYRP